ncbi:putative NAD dependent epimerase/dehydratase [Planoprotostelium fungivorum]|uniref:Putative NAD dependent epimerase/dehydratase n=1 Tax=Planoprotostelium fungivorum TaxID=1890364 RepID=A0A2P6NKD1_9EUKA|nr:putative NAD dependent epimerase/dehydratase [Planoprotostelium fungivorum]
MRIFVTGATGYIGGSVVNRLLKDGHQILGLVRTQDKADALSKLGVEPVLGSLEDHDLIISTAKKVDAVINTADADNRKVAELLIESLQGTGKKLIHTSGSSIISDAANGKYSEAIYSDDDTEGFKVHSDKEARVGIDRFVLSEADKKNVKAIVICPCLIYGVGTGLAKESVQLPVLVRQSKKRGAGVHVGDGLNVWSTVHVEDVAELYATAIQSDIDSSIFLFAESGESNFKDIAQHIAEAQGLKGITPWDPVEAVAEEGDGMVTHALGSNSRVRGKNARKLGWKPSNSVGLRDYILSFYKA